MKIRQAKKILKHQPENDPIGYGYNQYWVKRWDDHEAYPPKKMDQRINKAIRLANKRYKRQFNESQRKVNHKSSK